MLELRLFIMLRRYFGLVLILALTLAGALAETLRDDLWQRYQRYASPYLAPVAAGAPARPLASRVVVVVVRDLRLDVSRSMPTLNALREQGADIVLSVPAPTYRAPAWMTLLSGATPEIHGFTTNDTLGKVAPDTVLRRALAARRNTVVIGGQIWEDVLNNDIQRFDLAPAPASGDIDAETARAAVEVLNDRLTGVQLLFVELEGMTNRADARSVERVDAALRVIADAVSAPGPRATAALVVVADRGVLSDGSDGGEEEAIARIPLVMAGPGIRAGARLSASATAFAPTVAALAGLGMPAQAQGPILSAALQPAPLEASATQLATLYEAWSEVIRRPRFAAELFRGAQPAISAGSESAYQSLYISMTAAAESVREGRLSMERAQRLPVVGGIALLMIALAGLCVSAGGWRALAGAALILAGAAAFFSLGRNHELSLTSLPGGLAAPFYDETARDAATVFVVAGLLVAMAGAALEDVLQAVTAVMSALGLSMLALLCLPLYFYAQQGAAFTWALPDTRILFATVTALTGIAAIDLRVLPGNLPIPLGAVIAAGAALVYLLLRRRPARRWDSLR